MYFYIKYSDNLHPFVLFLFTVLITFSYQLGILFLIYFSWMLYTQKAKRSFLFLIPTIGAMTILVTYLYYTRPNGGDRTFFELVKFANISWQMINVALAVGLIMCHRIFKAQKSFSIPFFLLVLACILFQVYSNEIYYLGDSVFSNKIWTIPASIFMLLIYDFLVEFNVKADVFAKSSFILLISSNLFFEVRQTNMAIGYYKLIQEEVNNKIGCVVVSKNFGHEVGLDYIMDSVFFRCIQFY